MRGLPRCRRASSLRWFAGLAHVAPHDVPASTGGPMAPRMETMKIHHVSLPIGEEQVAIWSAFNEAVTPLVVPWLDQMLASGERHPLALPDYHHFSASAQEHDGALLVTLWTPLGSCRPGFPYRGKTEMLSAFGVAPDKTGAEIFWRSLPALQLPRGAEQPAAVWRQALPVATGAMVRPEAFGWLAGLQQAIASSWLRRATDSPSGLVVKFRTS